MLGEERKERDGGELGRVELRAKRKGRWSRPFSFFFLWVEEKRERQRVMRIKLDRKEKSGKLRERKTTRELNKVKAKSERAIRRRDETRTTGRRGSLGSSFGFGWLGLDLREREEGSNQLEQREGGAKGREKEKEGRSSSPRPEYHQPPGPPSSSQPSSWEEEAW